MIEVSKLGNDYFIEVNGKKIEGTLTNNHIWCFRKDMLNIIDDQDFDLYKTIKDFPIELLPERIEFVFFRCELNKEYRHLDRLPYPLTSFTFIKEDSQYTLGMSCFLEIEKWKRKWAASLYFDEIEKLVEMNLEFKVLKMPDTYIYDEGFEFFLETKVADIKTISEAFEQALPKYKKLIDKVEQQLSDVASLLKIIDSWKENHFNDNEEYWQKFFLKYSSIISQVFSAPAYIFKDKAYIGGKGIENKSGKIIDFVYKSDKTHNLYLIEIKTPVAKLIGSKYRGTNTISGELSGAINQLLQYKDIQQKEYYSLKAKSNTKFELFNPKCILILGNLSNLQNDELETFELFRYDLKSIEILTFDELFGKIELIMELIMENSN